MTAPDSNPQAVLREEILGDATRQRDRLLRRAHKEAETLLAQVKEEIDKDRLAVETETASEAARRRDMILASVAVEAGRIRARRVEALLRTIYDAAAARLANREGIDYRAVVVRLAGEALRRMEGETFMVELAKEDRQSFGEGLVADLVQAAGRAPLEITLVDAEAPDRLVIRDPAGRQVWENDLVSRFRRNWAVLRMGAAVQTGLVENVRPAGEKS